MTVNTETLYLSVDQVAQRFGVSKDSIWRWKRNGEFPKPYKLGGSTRWRLSDIEDWESRLTCGFVTDLDVGALMAR
jgi:prophage regulatory protein